MKIKFLFILFLLLLILFSGCISNNDSNSESIPPLMIKIYNEDSDINYTVNITLFYNNKTIFSINFTIKKGEKKVFEDITEKEDEYQLIVIVDKDIKKELKVYVEKDAYYVTIKINQNDIEMFQTFE